MNTKELLQKACEDLSEAENLLKQILDATIPGELIDWPSWSSLREKIKAFMESTK